MFNLQEYYKHAQQYSHGVELQIFVVIYCQSVIGLANCLKMIKHGRLASYLHITQLCIHVAVGGQFEVVIITTYAPVMVVNCLDPTTRFTDEDFILKGIQEQLCYVCISSHQYVWTTGQEEDSTELIFFTAYRDTNMHRGLWVFPPETQVIVPNQANTSQWGASCYILLD